MPLPSPLADDLPSSSESDRIAFFFVRLLLASCASSSESLPLIERRFESRCFFDNLFFFVELVDLFVALDLAEEFEPDREVRRALFDDFFDSESVEECDGDLDLLFLLSLRFRELDAFEETDPERDLDLEEPDLEAERERDLFEADEDLDLDLLDKEPDLDLERDLLDAEDDDLDLDLADTADPDLLLEVDFDRDFDRLDAADLELDLDLLDTDPDLDLDLDFRDVGDPDLDLDL